MPVLASRPASCPSPLDEADTHEQVDRVSNAMRRLPRRLRGLIRLYYGRGMLMKDIGEKIGVSESRVSQLCSEATELLRLYASESAA